MGQYWYFANVDKKYISDCWYKLHENFLVRGDDLLSVFLPPALNPDFAVDEWVRESALRSQMETRARLLRLPSEIIALIFDELITFHQLALAATCTSLFVIGVSRIAHAIRTAPDCQPWTGDRLIIIGDCTLADDMPAGMLTESEAAEFAKPLPPCDPDELEKPTHAPFDVWTRIFRQWQGSLCGDGMITMCYQVENMRRDRRARNGPQIAFEMLREMFVWDHAHLNAHRYVEGRVLRNISKRVFVRDSGIQALHARAPAGRTRSMPFGQLWPYGLSLGDVLFMRICWSSDPSAQMASEDELTRGQWAGDRFELAILDDGADTEGWRDVTDEVVEDMEWILKEERKWVMPGHRE